MREEQEGSVVCNFESLTNFTYSCVYENIEFISRLF